MTNFSHPEFERIYTEIFDLATTSWNTGRDRKAAYKSKDFVFIALSKLDCESHWDYMESMFPMKGLAFQGMVSIRFLLIFGGTLRKYGG